MEIRVDDLQGEAVIALLREHLESMAPTAPAESRHALDLQGLRSPELTFWSVWDGTELAGFGAIKHLTDEHAEIKSMRTASKHLRKGVASALLRHIIQEARDRGYSQVSLETGSMAFFAPARNLYASFGFIPCQPFGDYKPDPNSVFMTMPLDGSAPNSQQVSIVIFPETRVAAISHVGSPSQEHETARKLVAWKLEHRLLDQARYRSYGLHYTDPRTSNPAAHRVDFCLSYDGRVEPNAYGIVEMTIPAMRCAVARDIGSRLNNKAAQYLYNAWLPDSGEQIAAQPLVFHYVNVGPNVKDHEAITDVYLPLK